MGRRTNEFEPDAWTWTREQDAKLAAVVVAERLAKHLKERAFEDIPRGRVAVSRRLSGMRQWWEPRTPGAWVNAERDVAELIGLAFLSMRFHSIGYWLLLDDGARYRRPWTDGLNDKEQEGVE